MQTFTNILYIRIPVFDPDRCSRGWCPISAGSSRSGSCFIDWRHARGRVAGADPLRDVPQPAAVYQEFFSFKTVVYLWIGLGVVKVIHEFGHGLSCKAFGGEVHEMGMLFLCFSPAMYCNVSDAWTLPNKWHRIIISVAGIYVELMIAAIATFVWWNTPSQPFINNLCLSLMIVCSVSTVLFNANPLMRYDGYYVLADWLEIPNLRDRCQPLPAAPVRWSTAWASRSPPEPYMELAAADPVRHLRGRQLRLSLGGDVRHPAVHVDVPQAVQAGSHQQHAGGGGDGVDVRLAAVSHGQEHLQTREAAGHEKAACRHDCRRGGGAPGAVFLFAFASLRIRQGGIVQVQPGYAVPVHVQVSAPWRKSTSRKASRSVGDKSSPSSPISTG